MGWKKWPNWLKGATVTFSIILLYVAIIALANEIISNKCVNIGDACYNKYNPIIEPFNNVLVYIDVIYIIVTPFMDCNNQWFGCVFQHLWTEWPSTLIISLIIGIIYSKIVKIRRK